MCFYNGDYDWIALSVERSTLHSDGTKKFRCFDCAEIIPAGEECIETEMWEYEQCPDCGKRHDESDDCQDFEKDSGESDRIIQCRVCLDFREAIKDMEIKEGCKEYEATPNGSIGEEFGNMQDDDRVRAYVEHAAVMFPAQASAIRQRYGRFFEEEMAS